MPGPLKPTRACGARPVHGNAHKQEIRQTHEKRKAKCGEAQMGAHPTQGHGAH